MTNSAADRFRGDSEAKRRLPTPYDRDFSGVLQHLNRTSLANHPLTASFLCAGKRLLDQHLGPGGHCRCAAGRHDNPSLLGFLSQRNVVETLAGIPKQFPRAASQRALRDRWEPHSNYIADLVRFVVWEEVYRPGSEQYLQTVAARLVDDEDFLMVVQEIAYSHTSEGTELTSVRFTLALMIAAEGDDHITQAIRDAYRTYLGSWADVYEKVMSARGLRLRNGVKLETLVNALSVVTDGSILRAVVDPADVLDHDNQRSLMGSITLAILNSFLVRADESDDLTLEQAVASKLLGNPRSNSSPR